MPARVPFGQEPAIDGLRGVAVVAVIAFHFEPGWLPGGFLGVDTFFVVSGYLITRLLLDEWHRSRAVDLRSFWARRARRLLPALAVLLIAVAAAGAAWSAPHELGRLRADGLASLLYVQNWHLIASGDAYFDQVASPSPLRHLWSLAIEEQYYVLWPLVVLVCLRVARGSRLVVAGVCVLGAVASAVAMAALHDPADVARAYYGTDTRAQSVLVGAGLAVALEGGRFASAAGARWLRTAGALAAVAVVGSWLLVDDRTDWLYRGGFLGHALATTVVVTSVTLARRGLVARVLSWRPLVAVGRISYGLYLWHWPVHVFVTPVRIGLSGLALVAAKVAFTASAALASYTLVERPVRWGLGSAAVGRLAPVGAVAVVGAILVGSIGAAPVPDHLTTGVGFEEGVDGAGPPVVVQAPVGTSPPAPPAVDLPVSAVVFGDSVARSLEPHLATALAERGVLTVGAAVPGCGVIGGEPLALDGRPESFGRACAEGIVARQSENILRYRPDLVVWLSYWEWRDRLVDGVVAELGTPEGDRIIRELMVETVERTTATGAHLVVVLLPEIHDTPGVTHQPGFAEAVPVVNGLLREVAAARPDRVSVLDLGVLMCGVTVPCPRERDGIALRHDGLHFTEEGAAWVAPRVAEALLDPVRWRRSP